MGPWGSAVLAREDQAVIGDAAIPATLRLFVDQLLNDRSFPSLLAEAIAELRLVRVSVGVLDAQHIGLVLMVLHGEGATDMPDGYVLPRRAEGAWKAVVSGLPVFGSTEPTEGFLLEDVLLSREGVERYLCLPLRVRGVVRGTLNLGIRGHDSLPHDAPHRLSPLLSIVESHLATLAT